MPERLLTLPQAARELEMTADEALRLVESGALPAARGADGGMYVRLGDVRSFQARQPSA
jgi:hypothetical protein